MVNNADSERSVVEKYSWFVSRFSENRSLSMNIDQPKRLLIDGEDPGAQLNEDATLHRS
jgi:hypothetical protein